MVENPGGAKGVAQGCLGLFATQMEQPLVGERQWDEASELGTSIQLLVRLEGEWFVRSSNHLFI